MLRRAGLSLAAAFTLAVQLPVLAATAPGAPKPMPTPAGAPPAPAVPAIPAIQRFEYKVITYNRVALLGDSESDLRLLGLQGWELVSALFDPQARTIVCFLKRPL